MSDEDHRNTCRQGGTATGAKDTNSYRGKMDSHVEEEEEAAARREYERWKVGSCRYTCPRCEQVLPHSLRLLRHLATAHQGESLSVPGAEGNPPRMSALVSACRTETTFLRCRSCPPAGGDGAWMLYDYGEIRAHFRDVAHADGVQDPAQYFLRHVYGKAVEEDEELLGNHEAKSVVPAEEGPETESVARGGKELAETADGEESGVVRYSREGGEKRSEKLDSLCTFRCPKCYKIHRNWGSMLRHMRLSHPDDADSFKTSLVKGKYCFDLKLFLVDQVIYRCGICKKDLLCDREVVARHVWNRHQTRLSKYQRVSCPDSMESEQEIEVKGREGGKS